MDLRYKILHCLEKYPSTRNSDIDLTLKVWHEFHNSKLIEINGREYVGVLDLFELPREDHVKRIRAKIQNEEHKFLPTSFEVVKKRKINQEIWRTNMAKNNPAWG